MKRVQILCWYDCVGQSIRIPVGWCFRTPKNKDYSWWTKPLLWIMKGVTYPLLPFKFIIDHAKKCPGTYHHTIIYHLKFDVSIHLDIIHKWGCFNFCCGMFCFLTLFVLPLSSMVEQQENHPPWNPQGTWPADFMKLLRGANLRGFDTTSVRWMWRKKHHPGWWFGLVAFETCVF